MGVLSTPRQRDKKVIEACTCRIASGKDVLEAVQESVLRQWWHNCVFPDDLVDDIRLEYRASLPRLVL